MAAPVYHTGLRTGQGAGVYGMCVVELFCINLGESAKFWGEKFLKNLPHLPQVPRSKLGGKRSSFGGAAGWRF